MTEKFDRLIESLLREVLSGTSKRNKLKDMNHITPTPRILNNPSHIRPVNKSIGNETGVHSKDPDSKPVYYKRGVKPSKNKSQRNKLNSKNPYSARHDKHGTQLNLAARREKMLKNLKESSEVGTVPVFSGTLTLYKITSDSQDVNIKQNDILYKRRDALKIINQMKGGKEDIYFIKTVISSDQEKPVLLSRNGGKEYVYIGKESPQSRVIETHHYNNE